MITTISRKIKQEQQKIAIHIKTMPNYKQFFVRIHFNNFLFSLPGKRSYIHQHIHTHIDYVVCMCLTNKIIKHFQTFFSSHPVYAKTSLLCSDD